MLKVGLDTLWTDVLMHLQEELSTPSFEAWVKQMSPVALDDTRLEIAVPSDFTRQIIVSRYLEMIRSIVAKSLGRTLKVDITIAAAAPKNEEKKVEPAPNNKPDPHRVKEEPNAESNARLNPRYVFEAFVVGSSNRFAHAACLAVAEMPARAYNPLFLYGGVGLGKTHLMHAIGHHVLNSVSGSHVLYVSSENFTNEMINAIRDDKMVQFRQRYRNIDVLLIDDIQFVAGKERTQEEFFHTFEALHGARKQIVISSDRPPKDIPTLEERLRSRFEWGLITDVQPPDLETRIAILDKKAQMEQLSVPQQVLQFIATRIDTNIRELEGALIRVMAYASISHQPLTEDLAMTALKDVMPDHRPKLITIRLIQEEVARYYDLRVDDLKAKKRTRALAYPRQVAMYIAREMTDASLPKIGEEFGGRDHTTVIHACEKIDQEKKENAQLAGALSTLMQRIKTH
ncbi:MAG: chromosomal replication initiator protein DnaA [Firmicutes bacterium]|nr:chromosomal replication initiator protein DnaA [Bacillota bacterium]